MGERIHKIRELLMECDKMAQWMSSEVSAQRIPADLAPLVDAMRHSVLTAMRVAHATELGAKLVEL
jgi:transposase